jgi:hypothetical protein
VAARFESSIASRFNSLAVCPKKAGAQYGHIGTAGLPKIAPPPRPPHPPLPPSKGITEFCGTEGARPSGAAGNTDRKGYSRPVVSGSSVNVIANPVRVAPIPKVIAHVPTNVIIMTSGVGL